MRISRVKSTVDMLRFYNKSLHCQMSAQVIRASMVAPAIDMRLATSAIVHKATAGCDVKTVRGWCVCVCVCVSLDSYDAGLYINVHKIVSLRNGSESLFTNYIGVFFDPSCVHASSTSTCLCSPQNTMIQNWPWFSFISKCFLTEFGTSLPDRFVSPQPFRMVWGL